jgi:hypothetical protein
MAIQRRPLESGPRSPSRSWQPLCRRRLRRHLAGHRHHQSMGRKANCSDNCAMKSFFGTLRAEFPHPGQASTPIVMPRGSTCSPIYRRPTTMGSCVVPRSATSPLNRQRLNPRIPMSTFPGKGHRSATPSGGTVLFFDGPKYLTCRPGFPTTTE